MKIDYEHYSYFSLIVFVRVVVSSFLFLELVFSTTFFDILDIELPQDSDVWSFQWNYLMFITKHDYFLQRLTDGLFYGQLVVMWFAEKWQKVWVAVTEFSWAVRGAVSRHPSGCRLRPSALWKNGRLFFPCLALLVQLRKTELI